MVVHLCFQAKVSPVAFNQGAWVLGSREAEDFGTLRKAMTNSPYSLDEEIQKRKEFWSLLENS
jgi:hypothetical protein